MIAPKINVRAPAMDQDQRFVALSITLVVYSGPIERSKPGVSLGGGFIGRLRWSTCGRKGERENQQQKVTCNSGGKESLYRFHCHGASFQASCADVIIAGLIPSLSLHETQGCQ